MPLVEQKDIDSPETHPLPGGGSFTVHPQVWKYGPNQYRGKVRIQKAFSDKRGNPYSDTYFIPATSMARTNAKAMKAAKNLAAATVTQLRSRR